MNRTNMRALLVSALQIGSSISAGELANGLQLDLNDVNVELEALVAEGAVVVETVPKQPAFYSLKKFYAT